MVILVNVMTVFNNHNRNGQQGGTVAVLRSTNRGRSWGGPITISPLGTVGVTDPKDGHDVRTGDIIPEIASDERPGSDKGLCSLAGRSIQWFPARPELVAALDDCIFLAVPRTEFLCRNAIMATTAQ